MYIQQFLSFLELEKRYSIHTVQSYQKDLEDFTLFLKYTENNLPIEKAQKLHIRNFMVTLSDEGIAARSINRKISALKKFYTYLLQQEIINSSPAHSIKSIKTKKRIHVPLSEEEMNVVFEKYSEEDFKTFQEKLIIETLYQTGMRRTELINLKIEDINFSNKNIKVLGKRNKERLIPTSEYLLKTIQQFITLKENKEIISPYLFSLESGKKLYPKFVYNVVITYLSASTTKEKKSPHMLRHTFATHILNRGAEINSVKELLGHSSLASTQVYIHQDIEKLKEVLQKSHPRGTTENKKL